MKIVEVDYLDCHTIEGIANIERIKKETTPLLKIAAYLIQDTKERIVVCAAFYPEEDEDKNVYSYPHFIPKSSIIKIRELK